MGQMINLVPWVLTHQDLSGMNILVDPDSGHITGVVEWVDATIEPFGMALWGLESVLGCSGPNGWSYFGSDPSYSHFGCDPSRSRALFWRTFLREIAERSQFLLIVRLTLRFTLHQKNTYINHRRISFFSPRFWLSCITAVRGL